MPKDSDERKRMKKFKAPVNLTYHYSGYIIIEAESREEAMEGLKQMQVGADADIYYDELFDHNGKRLDEPTSIEFEFEEDLTEE